VDFCSSHKASGHSTRFDNHCNPDQKLPSSTTHNSVAVYNFRQQLLDGQKKIATAFSSLKICGATQKVSLLFANISVGHKFCFAASAPFFKCFWLERFPNRRKNVSYKNILLPVLGGQFYFAFIQEKFTNCPLTN